MSPLITKTARCPFCAATVLADIRLGGDVEGSGPRAGSETPGDTGLSDHIMAAHGLPESRMIEAMMRWFGEARHGPPDASP